MDTSDAGITFDSRGRCDYCRNYYEQILPTWHPDERGEAELALLAEKIKREGKGKSYDCILGISGGPDSSYAAYIAKEKMGLRPMLFHVDAGWNSQQAVRNIERLVDGLNVDLYTEVIDWEEMKDLQLAFLRAQIPDQDHPQDTAFFSGLYKFAAKHGVKYVLTGANFSTECCREPEEWGAYPGIDVTLINAIHRRHGTRSLKTFPMVDVFQSKLYYTYVLGMKVVKPLNYTRYVKVEAEANLTEKFGWEPFKHKHHESRFTRFFEDYWLPRKFGYDKRRAHFSSLVLTGQMTRDEALRRVQEPEMDESFWPNEFEFVAKKLGLAPQELQTLFEGENRTYHSYPNKRLLVGLGATGMKWLGLERRLFR